MNLSLTLQAYDEFVLALKKHDWYYAQDPDVVAQAHKCAEDMRLIHVAGKHKLFERAYMAYITAIFFRTRDEDSRNQLELKLAHIRLQVEALTAPISIDNNADDLVPIPRLSSVGFGYGVATAH